MTARDPDLQRAVDAATAWWAQHLAGRLLPGMDPDRLAEQGVEHMCTELGWRPWPRDPAVPDPHRRDPQVAARGAEEARRALAHTKAMKIIKGEADA